MPWKYTIICWQCQFMTCHGFMIDTCNKLSESFRSCVFCVQSLHVCYPSCIWLTFGSILWSFKKWCFLYFLEVLYRTENAWNICPWTSNHQLKFFNWSFVLYFVMKLSFMIFDRYIHRVISTPPVRNYAFRTQFEYNVSACASVIWLI